jgi:hypothetical protein
VPETDWYDQRRAGYRVVDDSHVEAEDFPDHLGGDNGHPLDVSFELCLGFPKLDVAVKVHTRLQPLQIPLRGAEFLDRIGDDRGRNLATTLRSDVSADSRPLRVTVGAGRELPHLGGGATQSSRSLLPCCRRPDR